MTLTLLREFKRDNGVCIGRLLIGDKHICYTLEPPDYGFRRFYHDVIDIRKAKQKYGRIAIPRGEYDLQLNVPSQKFAGNSFYNSCCNGCLPRLKSVPGFEGILIHCGNSIDDTTGCILVGESVNYKSGVLISSRNAFRTLMQELNYVKNNLKRDEIKINIVDSL